MARIDINRDGTGCKTAWTNNKVRTPSAVSKGDSANGLSTRTRTSPTPAAPIRGTGPRSTTAPARSSGASSAGYGGLFNNHYAGIALGKAPGGKPTLYLGGIGGIMALRDG